MADVMTFPDAVEEFMEQYKITDTEQVYTNGTELVPIFRMKQWFEAHKPEPCEDAVSREALRKAMYHRAFETDGDTMWQSGCWVRYRAIEQVIKESPSVTPERKKGKWTEKHHAYSDEESVIEEWQSCRCSECGRYDTRPYMYYFSEPNYCSYCGADMRGEKNENR